MYNLSFLAYSASLKLKFCKVNMNQVTVIDFSVFYFFQGHNMLESDIVDVFKVCPSLRFIEGYGSSKAYYDQITRTVVIKGRGSNATYVI